jgi:hypothetical protein
MAHIFEDQSTSARDLDETLRHWISSCAPPSLPDDSTNLNACYALAEWLQQPDTIAANRLNPETVLSAQTAHCAGIGVGCEALRAAWKRAGVRGRAARIGAGEALQAGCKLGLSEACITLAQHTDRRGRAMVCSLKDELPPSVDPMSGLISRVVASHIRLRLGIRDRPVTAPDPMWFSQTKREAAITEVNKACGSK